jgi:hypothetical protein
MKTFFFVGKNENNLSRISCKIWKIRRSGRRVEAQWGPARWDKQKRKVVPVGLLQRKAWSFRTREAAEHDAERRTQEKLREGYERVPRRKAQ